MRIMGDDLKRLLSKLDTSGGPESCWPFRGALNGWGYGNFWFHGQWLGAHRMAYRLLVGPIPEGLQVDHLCHRRGVCVGLPCPHRACCNPTHLGLATPRDNGLRGNGQAARAVRVTHCPRGHEYDEANTYHRPDLPGHRDCRKCKAIAQRNYLARKAERSD